jgi:prevent-host-death family protein
MRKTSISIQDLKARLSAVVADAEAGQTILVTRHNTPVAQLGPAVASHVHRGPRTGGPRLKPALKRGTGGRALAVLLDDRGNR